MVPERSACSDGRLFKQKGSYRFPVSRMVTEEVRKKGDTTGCGDNFAGGIIESVAIQRKSDMSKPIDLVQAVAQGVAAGGFACSYLGGTFKETFMYEKRDRIRDIREDYLKQINIHGKDR
jgi:sugar/nucleoside kinase (ribokinase family)